MKKITLVFIILINLFAYAQTNPTYTLTPVYGGDGSFELSEIISFELTFDAGDDGAGTDYTITSAKAVLATRNIGGGSFANFNSVNLTSTNLIGMHSGTSIALSRGERGDSFENSAELAALDPAREHVIYIEYKTSKDGSTIYGSSVPLNLVDSTVINDSWSWNFTQNTIPQNGIIEIPVTYTSSDPIAVGGIKFDFNCTTGSPYSNTFIGTFSNTEELVAGTNVSTTIKINSFPDSFSNENGHLMSNAELLSSNPNGVTLASGTIYYYFINSINGDDANFTPSISATGDRFENFTENTSVNATIASGSWSSASNWSAGSIPSSTDNVVIRDGQTISLDSNVAINDLNIVGTGVLSVDSGTSLTINGDLIQKGNLNVNSSASNASSLILNGDSYGTITYNRYVTQNNTSGFDGWHLVAAPFVGQSYGGTWMTDNNIASGTGNNKGIATYVSATDSWSYVQAMAVANFQSGTGYSVKKGTAAGVLSFTGTANTNNDGVDVLVNTNGNGYNLIGNPYPSYINSGTFLANNSNLEQTIWVFDSSTKNYIAKIAGDAFKVAPGQGFFVKVLSGTEVNFAENLQSHESVNTFLKASNQEIKLNITDGEIERFSKLYYLENATKGFDNGFEGEVFTGIEGDLDIYTQLLTSNLGKNYQIQSLPNTNLETMIVPIGVNALAGKEIKISIETSNLPEGLKVFIEDKLTNTFTRLDVSESSYKTVLNESLKGTGRFYLHTAQKSLSVEKDLDLEHINVFSTKNRTLKVVGLNQSEKAGVKLFNLLGKEVLAINKVSKSNSDILLPNLSKGIYIVQLSTKEGKLNKKIILE